LHVCLAFYFDNAERVSFHKENSSPGRLIALNGLVV